MRLFSQEYGGSDVLTLMASEYDDLAAGGFLDQLAAYYDFSLAVPIERVSSGRIGLGGRAEVKFATPGLRLAGGAYAAISNEPDANPAGCDNDPFTVQVWACIERAAGKTVHTVFANGDPVDEAGLSLYFIKQGEAWNVGVQRGNDDALLSRSTVEPGTWVNVCAVYDGLSTLSLFIDGVLDAKLDTCVPIVEAMEEPVLRIGAEPGDDSDNGDKVMAGCVGRLDLWSRALSAEDVLAYAKSEPDPSVEGLVFSCNFSAGSVNNVVSTNPIGLRNGAEFGEVYSAPAADSDFIGLEDHRDSNAVGTDGLSESEIAAERAACLGSPHAAQLPFREHGSGRAREGCRLDSRILYEDVRSFCGNDIPVPSFEEFEDLANRRGGNNPCPILASHVQKEGRTYFLVHYRDRSEVVGALDEVDIDEETTWWIEFILIIVTGLLQIILGISVKGGGALTSFIRRHIVSSPAIRSLLPTSWKSVAAIFTVLMCFKRAGVLKDLVKSALSGLSWFKVVWAIGTFVASVAAIASGAGLAYYALAFADLVVSITAHIASKPESVNMAGVSLRTLEFSEGSSLLGSNEASSFVLRTDGSKSLARPEWCAAPSRQDPVAYAMSAVKGKSIVVRASFIASGKRGASGTVSVRAVDVGGVKTPGDSDAVTVSFPNYAADNVKITFKNHSLAAFGVGTGTISLRWEVDTGDGWVDVCTTNSPLYVTLSLPWQPWSAVYESRAVWTTLLDQACLWAKGSLTEEDAQSAITNKVYSGLGFSYNLPYGASNYIVEDPYGSSIGVSYCIADMIDRTFNTVNCSDCASTVATYANALGCRVHEVRMSDMGEKQGYFKFRKVKLIGSQTWEGGKFTYHEVATKVSGSATSNSSYRIYDACCEINAEPDDAKPIVPILPCGLVFSEQEDSTVSVGSVCGGEGDVDSSVPYRERFAEPGSEGVGSCQLEIPAYVTPILTVHKGASVSLHEDALFDADGLVETAAAEMLHCPQAPRYPKVACCDVSASRIELAGWRLVMRHALGGRGGSHRSKYTWNEDPSVAVRVDVYAYEGYREACGALALLLRDGYSMEAPKPAQVGTGCGDVCYLDQGCRLFVRSNVVVSMVLDMSRRDGSDVEETGERNIGLGVEGALAHLAHQFDDQMVAGLS